MKRTLLAGSFYALAGVATLLLAASIFYSCRSGGDPHHEQRFRDAPSEESHSSGESHSSIAPDTPSGAMRLTLADAQSSSSLGRCTSDRASTA